MTNRKRDWDAFNEGQNTTSSNTYGFVDYYGEGTDDRPGQVTKIVKTEQENNTTSGIAQKPNETKQPDGKPKPDGLQPDGLAFPLDHPQKVELGKDPQCANCRLFGHAAYRCMGPWDPVRGTIKVCVLCNSATHGLDDCPTFKTETDDGTKRQLLSTYLLIYRRGRPPIESKFCWVDLLNSRECKELMFKRPHVAERGYSPYPWTREFAVSQHQHRPWDNYNYVKDTRSTWPKDPKTSSELELQKNLDSLKKTEPSAAVDAALKATAKKILEDEMEREWELNAAGLKVWPDIMTIAPKLKAYVEKGEF
ncbi:hypothetical protein B0T20DRAFT_511252 [Sordaria brevicollis]|uniref:Uncharacterized protein n=1 Tax=Sordaria brevicollis TaxID=83679 RepID=A0AAE0NVK7_SORBR|nr:hypothetical protein B0T20DRAFT_511252 [Sordaria brevicollis]